MYKPKYTKITITIDPDVLSTMKEYLAEINKDKSMKHVSQSEFITESIKLFLLKEYSNEQ